MVEIDRHMRMNNEEIVDHPLYSQEEKSLNPRQKKILEDLIKRKKWVKQEIKKILLENDLNEVDMRKHERAQRKKSVWWLKLKGLWE